jgi:F-type H+-transporting ATPase subunit epsilon
VHLKIITPESVVLDIDDVRHILLPAELGEMGIMPGHISGLFRLQIGRLAVETETETVELATSGGFAEVLGDDVTIMAETAERADQIDMERAERAQKRAEELLRSRGERRDDATIRSELSRAMNRLRIGGA